MKKHLLGSIAVWVAFLIGTASGAAQTTPVARGPEQECFNAIKVCQPIIRQLLPYSGVGGIINEIIPGATCLMNPEENSVWYTFTTGADGRLGFRINPIDGSDVYNWALYRVPAGSAVASICSQLRSNNNALVACRIPPVGSGLTGVLDTTSDAFVSRLPVSRNETYILYIGTPTGKAGFTLDFTPSSAGIIVNEQLPTKPTMSFVPIQSPRVGECGQVSTLTVTFSQNVLCWSAQPSSFLLTGPGGPYTVTAVAANLCNPTPGAGTAGVNDYTQPQVFTLTISPTLSRTGTYVLSTNPTASIPLRDVCQIPIVGVSQSLLITVGNAKPPMRLNGVALVPNSPATDFCLGQNRTLETDDLGSGTRYRWLTVPGGQEVRNLRGQSINSSKLTVFSRYREDNQNVTELAVDSSQYYQQVDVPPTFYAVEVTDAAGCVRTSDAFGLNVRGESVDSITVVYEECRAVARLSVPTGSVRYRWFRDGRPIQDVAASQPAISASQEGTYSVEIVRADGCKNIASKAVRFSEFVRPPIVDGPNFICEGGTIALALTQTQRDRQDLFEPNSYQWFEIVGRDTVAIPRATGQFFTATKPGLYVLRARTLSRPACPPNSSDAKSVALSPAPPTPRINGFADSTSSVTVDCNGGAAKLQVNYSVQTDTQGFTYQWFFNGKLLPNVNVDNILAAEVGVYSVRAFNRNGCPSTGLASIRVIGRSVPNPTPTAISPVGVSLNNGAVTICAGDTLVLDAGTRDAAGMYEAYQWSRNGTNISIAAGGTQQRLRITESGTYRVEVIASGCKGSAQAVVTVRPIPNVTIDSKPPGRDFFCEGDSLELEAGLNPITMREYDTYTWTRMGSTAVLSRTRTAFVKEAGVYLVRVTDGACVGTGASRMIRVEVRPSVPVITSDNGKFAFCPGKSLTLSTGVPPAGQTFTYQWFRNGLSIPSATTRTLVVTQAGNYNVEVTNMSGCKNRAPRDQNVTELTLPTQPRVAGSSVICDTGRTSTVLIAEDPTNPTRPYTTYQWFREGQRIEGASSSMLTVTTPGQYSVQVTNGDSCTNTSVATMVTRSSPMTSITGTNFGASFVVSSTPALGMPLNIQWTLSRAGMRDSIVATNVTTFNPSVEGTYTVRVADVNGCVGTFSRDFRLPVITVFPVDSTGRPISGSIGPNGSTLSAAPGDQVRLGIRFTSAGSLLPGAQLSGLLRFNATLLEPISPTPQGRVVNGVREIPVTFILPSNVDSISLILPLRAALGNDSTTRIRLDSMRITSVSPPSLIQVRATNQQIATFTLLNLSRAGGIRLIGPPPSAEAKRILEGNRPNPASTETAFLYDLDRSDNVTLTLSDVYGRVVKAVELAALPAGKGEIVMNVSDVVPGVYFAVLKTASGRRETLRITITR